MDICLSLSGLYSPNCLPWLVDSADASKTDGPWCSVDRPALTKRDKVGFAERVVDAWQSKAAPAMTDAAQG